MIDFVPLCMELNGVIDQGENLRKYKQINQFASHFYARHDTAVLTERGNGENMDWPEEYWGKI